MAIFRALVTGLGLCVSVSNLFAATCDVQQLNICLQYGGGNACYTKWHCESGTFASRGTAYYPDDSTLEGGYLDRLGKPLRTLQDYLQGTAVYVSAAMDVNAFPYGTRLRIPELEKKYGRVIEFRVVDAGGAFKDKGTSRIDICVRNYAASLDATINGPLTLVLSSNLSQ